MWTTASFERLSPARFWPITINGKLHQRWWIFRARDRRPNQMILTGNNTMRLNKIILALLCITAAGCQDSKPQTPSEVGSKQWNDARAGVLGSLAMDQYKNGSFDKCQATLDEALH